MDIVDSQVHVWAAETPERPWPKSDNRPHRPVPFLPEDLLREMDAAGVHRAVLVPPTWDGGRNDLALGAARLHPDRFAVMGRLNTDAPEAREQLRNWRTHPQMLGLRFSFMRLPAERWPLIDEGLDWVWTEAERAGLPIMLMMIPGQLHLADRIAARHPGLRLIMDHLARHYGRKDEAAFADLDKLLALAPRPNIAVKASGMPAYASDSYPYRRVHEPIRQAREAFGSRRVFWGTDLTKLQCSYRQAVTMFTEELPWLTAADKEWIMGRGLCEWIGWPLPRS
jgi:predicted TIM-barrel fold metal-dependent hydrolase